ncbi:ATP synthase subunit s, mitochondrial [Dermatophagoides pteronyssinus]|uniref:ATP synthase subunit s, mitochondrial n=1 Tax=Dermatophagoides pteronyssinus TaxID=6956 RepID=UPI003F6781B3
MISKLIRLSPYLSKPSNSRQLFEWLNAIFNAVDRKRIEELGPNRAAAEWLIRNGAAVFWSSQKDCNFNDYDRLIAKPEEFRDNYIIGIDATESSINHAGFEYLRHLKRLSRIIFNKTKYLNDKALIMLSEYQLAELRHLEIRNCYNVTDTGIQALKELKSLQYLKMENLPSVDNRTKCEEILKKSLSTSCRIEWNPQ